MGDLRTWFAAELRELGWGGMEGVYDYLPASGPEAESYLRSLLGESPAAVGLAQAFVRYRASGHVPSRDAGGAQGAQQADEGWAGGGARGGDAKGRGKRGRSRGRGGGGGRAAGSAKPSFASATTGDVRPKETAASKAVQESAVELTRRKVREYRRAKQAVNCIRCGKVELIIQEDGACSFCGAPIFSMWDGSGAGQAAGASSSFRRGSGGAARGERPGSSSRHSQTIIVDISGRPMSARSETADGRPTARGPTNAFSNPLLPGSGPQYDFAQAQELLDAANNDAVLRVTGRVHREVPLSMVEQ